jgi:hypothetical protein
MPFDYERWKKSQFSQNSPMEEEATFKAVFPRSIMWTGLIWCTIGGLHLGFVLMSYFRTWTFRDSGGPIIAGFFYLYAGLRAATGTTPGTVLSGIVSILFGLVWIGVVLLTAKTEGFRPNDVMMMLICCAMGLAILVAGFLAVTGGSSYQVWRNARMSERSRSW